MFNTSLPYTNDQLSSAGYGESHEDLRGLDCDHIRALYSGTSNSNSLFTPPGPNNMANFILDMSYPGFGGDAQPPMTWSSRPVHATNYHASRLPASYTVPPHPSFHSDIYMPATPPYPSSYPSNTSYLTPTFPIPSMSSQAAEQSTSMSQANYTTTPTMHYDMSNLTPNTTAASATPSPSITPVTPTRSPHIPSVVNSSAHPIPSHHRQPGLIVTAPTPVPTHPHNTLHANTHIPPAPSTPTYLQGNVQPQGNMLAVPGAPPLLTVPVPRRRRRVSITQSLVGRGFRPTSPYTVRFSTNGVPGFRVKDIKAGRFHGLDHADEPALDDVPDRSVHIYITLPGALPNPTGNYFITRDYSPLRRKPPGPAVPYTYKTLAQAIVNLLESAAAKAQRELFSAANKSVRRRSKKEFFIDVSEYYVTYLSSAPKGWVLGLQQVVRDSTDTRR